MWGHTKRMTVLRYIWVRCRQHTHQHLSTGVFPQTFASSVANVILGGCKRYPWRTHIFAMSDASTCRNGCKYLRLNLDQIGSADAVHCRTGCSALRGKPLFFSQPHGLCHEQRDEGFLARARIRIYIMYNSSSSDGKPVRKCP